MDLSILASLASASAPLKTAMELAGAVLATKDEVKIQALMHTLYKEIASAQMGMLTAGEVALKLQQRVQELEKKINDVEAWNREAARYELIEFGDNTFAWKLRSECASGEPAHLLCPGCFASGKKGLLQFAGTNFHNQRRYVCAVCRNAISLGHLHPVSELDQRLTRADWMGS